MKPVIEKSDVIITMLPSTKICQDVYTNHVFKYAEPGTLMIDSSTIHPGAAQTVKVIIFPIYFRSFTKKELKRTLPISMLPSQEASPELLLVH